MEDRYSDYVLVHHGILGMRWGVRRYQNKDGSLTALGKVHRVAERVSKKAGEKAKEGISNTKIAIKNSIKDKREFNKRVKEEQKKLEESQRENKIKEQARARQEAAEVARINALRLKPVQLMSDTELATLTARFKAEKSYKDALASITPAKKKTAGDKIKSMLSKFGDTFVTELSKSASKTVDDMIKEGLGIKTNNQKPNDQKPNDQKPGNNQQSKENKGQGKPNSENQNTRTESSAQSHNSQSSQSGRSPYHYGDDGILRADPDYGSQSQSSSSGRYYYDRNGYLRFG